MDYYNQDDEFQDIKQMLEEKQKKEKRELTKFAICFCAALVAFSLIGTIICNPSYFFDFDTAESSNSTKEEPEAAEHYTSYKERSNEIATNTDITPQKEETAEVFDYSKVPMESVSSSFIDAVGYSTEYEVLLIQINGTDLYQYNNVDISVYRSFINAESLGKYFNANIKGQYDYEKIY